MWVMRSSDQNKKGRQIVACAKGSLNDANQIIDIGPLAVRPDYQVKNIIYYTDMHYRENQRHGLFLNKYFYFRAKVLVRKYLTS